MTNQFTYQKPLSLNQFEQRFPNDEACAEDLFRRRWLDGFVCPDCGSRNAARLKRKRCVHQCRDCRKQTSVTAGTFMHRSHVSLRNWYRALHMMTAHLNGMSALQLQRVLGLGSYKSAWMLVHKIRRAMEGADGFPLNAACEAVRKALRTELTPARRQQGLVNDWFLILKRKHWFNGKEFMILSGWLENYPALAVGYEVKAVGYRIYDAKTRDDADLAFEEWRASVPQEMKGAFGEFERAWQNWSEEILVYFGYRATNAYTESLNNLNRTTNCGSRGYSFEALRAKVLLSEGLEKKEIIRPRFQKMLSRDHDIEMAMHEMRVPTRYEGRFGTPLSTLTEILGDAGHNLSRYNG